MFNKLINPPLDGGLPFFNVDFVNIESYGADALKAYLNSLLASANNSGSNYDKYSYTGKSYNTADYGLVLSGGIVSNLISGVFDVSGGIAYLDGEFVEFPNAVGLDAGANDIYLVRSQNSTKTQRTAQSGFAVDFTEVYAGQWIEVPTGTSADPSPWATQFIAWDIADNIGIKETPCLLSYVNMRATALDFVLFASGTSGFSTATSFGKGKYHGFYIANGSNGTLDWTSASPAGGQAVQRK